MAKINAKEAQLLLQRHDDFIDTLKKIKGSYDRQREDVRQLANKMEINHVFSQAVQQQIRLGMSSVDDEQIRHLLHEIYRAIGYQKNANDADQLLKLNEEEVRQLQQTVRPALSGLRRLFMSSSNRLKAEIAYEKLEKLASESYAEKIQLLGKRMQECATASESTALEAFCDNKTAFKGSLYTCAPALFGATKVMEEAECFSSAINRVNQSLKDVQQLSGKFRDNIQRAIQRMRTKACLDTLKKIPVEEISKRASGIRVKLLKANGFETMADIFLANHSNISDISGISSDGAFSIKLCAQTCANEVMQITKLKLNADNRNDEASALVQAVYLYRNNQIGITNAGNFLRTEEGSIRTAIEKIRGFGPIVNWFFMEDSECKRVSAAYNYLVDRIGNTFFSEVNRRIEIARLSFVDANAAWNDFIVHNIEYFQLLEDIEPGAFGNADSDYGLPEELAREIQDEAFFPDGLKLKLRRYQEWGVKYILHQGKVLLGDEMGLGKTMQAIASMVSLKNTGATHFIVVCPASVLPNWSKEIKDKSKLRAITIYGPTRYQAIEEWKKSGGVALTNYETTEHFRLDDGFKYSMITVDEAHYIKNRQARRSINTRRLSEYAERILYMTGTPIENKVDEMVTLIEDLNPVISKEILRNKMLVSAPVFRERIAPVYYRRKREDVLSELPELIENQDWCMMTAQETKAYEAAVLLRKYAETRRVSWNVDDLAFSSKANRLREIIEDAKEDGRKVLVFSFFLDTIESIHKSFKDICMQPINGSVPIQRRQEIIDEFDNAPAGSVLLAQIQSGGTGLNIQTASVVVICEPQLKPSIENQAISRAYRMGQARNVLVHRLLCINSVDERITDMLAEKQRVFDEYADKSVAAEESINLDSRTFGNIIEEEIERIKAKQGREKAVN